MKGDFLDFTKEHKLSETECELITMFRTLNKTQQQIVFKMLFDVVSENTIKSVANKTT